MFGIGMKELVVIAVVIGVFIVLSMILPAKYGSKKESGVPGDGEGKK